MRLFTHIHLTLTLSLTCTLTLIRIRTRTHTHTYMHTHTYTYTYTLHSHSHSHTSYALYRSPSPPSPLSTYIYILKCLFLHDATHIYVYTQDYYLENTHVGVGEICGPSNIGGLSGNIYLTLTPGEDSAGEQDERVVVPEPPGGNKCDPGTKKTATIADIHQIAKDTIQIGPH